MGNYKKGVAMRQYILREARKTFNRRGLQVTLGELARELHISNGRITNYFPTKDHLFAALSKDYDIRFADVITSFPISSPLSLAQLAKLFGAVMDLQHEFRSTIIFVCSTHPSQQVLHRQVSTSYSINRQQVKVMVDALVDAGLLTSDIQEPEEFEIFSFQHVNLFTTWVVSLSVYYYARSYRKMKPVYLRGILMCYYPYLTAAGRAQLKSLQL